MAISNLAEFQNTVRRFAQRLPEDHLVPWQRNLALRVLKGAMDRTPVDTGRAVGNWVVSIADAPPSEPTAKIDPSGDITFAAGVAALASLRPFQVIWISNSVPYILVLEYGLYPNPPKYGTYLPKKGRSFAEHGVIGGLSKLSYIVYSQGGFSKQAVGGMLLVTLQNVASVYPD